MLNPIAPKDFDDMDGVNYATVNRARHGGMWFTTSLDTAVIELSRNEAVKLRDYITKLLDEP